MDKLTETAKRSIEAVLAWQADSRVHPLTCGNASGHPTLRPYVTSTGDVSLICTAHGCGYIQGTIPAVVLARYLRTREPAYKEADHG